VPQLEVSEVVRLLPSSRAERTVTASRNKYQRTFQPFSESKGIQHAANLRIERPHLAFYKENLQKKIRLESFLQKVEPGAERFWKVLWRQL
jgi:hypothetical protein